MKGPDPSTVLIVGASGFIGRHVTARLASGGVRVYAHYHSAAPPLDTGEVLWIPGDLRQATVSRAWPPRCDHVVYLAQSPARDDLPANAPDVFDVNVAGALGAITYAVSAHARSFILASSGSVYGDRRGPARESDALRLDGRASFYAASKLAAEALIAPYARRLTVIRLRIYAPYGPGQDSRQLISDLVRRVRERRAIDLHGADGMVINPLWVGDLAEAIRRCLPLETSAVLNVGGPEPLTLREIGDCIGRITGIPPRFAVHPDQTAPVVVGDTTALRAALGWSPPTTLESGLERWLGDAADRGGSTP
jgi:nucleoside-diphosphate-sugar epimerase